MFLVPMTRGSSELARNFDRLFDEGFDRFFAPAAADAEGRPRSPALDVSESDRAYTIKLDLPGVAKEEVKISIDGRRISIEAQTRKDEERKEGERVVYRERSMSSYARSFTVASDIDQAESGAKLENGVLKLTLSKRGAPAAARITVS
jgi:HSP20 family protein